MSASIKRTKWLILRSSANTHSLPWNLIWKRWKGIKTHLYLLFADAPQCNWIFSVSSQKIYWIVESPRPPPSPIKQLDIGPFIHWFKIDSIYSQRSISGQNFRDLLISMICTEICKFRMEARKISGNVWLVTQIDEAQNINRASKSDFEARCDSILWLLSGNKSFHIPPLASIWQFIWHVCFISNINGFWLVILPKTMRKHPEAIWMPKANKNVRVERSHCTEFVFEQKKKRNMMWNCRTNKIKLGGYHCRRHHCRLQNCICSILSFEIILFI